MMHEKILWYIADPMCSWCWGFAPVIEAIRWNYCNFLKIELVLGGLRPGTKQTIAPVLREEILHHWKAVERATGQSFRFEGAMSEGFIYDTEPASRGVVAMSLINPEIIFPFFESTQFAFYAEQKDVTKPEILAQLAADIGIDAKSFLRVFESDEAKNQTSIHFDKARRWGVFSFPTVIVQNVSGYSILNRGYCPLEALCLQLDDWLKM